MTQYNGYTTLVTGSSRGVGRVIAEHFLAGNAEVIGLARGSSDLNHDRYHHFEVDICDDQAVLRVFEALRNRRLSVDILVNNAAVLTSQYAMIMPMEHARNMVNVNLLAPFHISREASKMMRRKKWGRIINISSMGVRLEPQGDSIYAASKAALTTVSNVMAKELSRLNVTCNTVGVTAFETDMLSQLPRVKVDEIIQNLPVARYAEPDDILNVIDFFASPRSSYITAQTVYLGGIS